MRTTIALPSEHSPFSGAHASTLRGASELAAAALHRGVRHLVHFTPLCNLPGIRADGLLSRNRLSGREVLFTDPHRFDGMLDWISLSVSFPNYRMFWRKRQYDLPGLDWAVLLLDPAVLWRSECLFVPNNAASMGHALGQRHRFRGPQAFASLFDNRDRPPYLPASYPTNVQAEVLVLGQVPASSIRHIAVEDADTLRRTDSDTRQHIHVAPQWFWPRMDHGAAVSSDHFGRPGGQDRWV